jgi:hypothetical protein
MRFAMSPEPTRWDDMSEAAKVEYAMENWADLSKARIQECFRLFAERNRKREEQRQARKRQQSPRTPAIRAREARQATCGA